MSRLGRVVAAVGLATAVVAGAAVTAGAESPQIDEIPLDIQAPADPVPPPQIDLPLTSGDEVEKRFVRLSLIGVYTIDDGDGFLGGCGEFDVGYYSAFGDTWWGLSTYGSGEMDFDEPIGIDNLPFLPEYDMPDSWDLDLCDGDPYPYTDLSDVPNTQMGLTLELDDPDEPFLIRLGAEEYDHRLCYFCVSGERGESAIYGYSIAEPQVFEEWIPIAGWYDEWELIMGIRIEVSEVPELGGR